MSSILLTNPFVAPPQSSLIPESPTSAAPVAPVPAGGAASSSGDAASFTGSGAGSGKQADNVALFQAKDTAKWGRPFDATSDSVIGAQAKSTIDALPLGPDLPEVEMPDPLPTSPFLKPNDLVE